MICNRVKGLLSAFSDGELGGTEMLGIREHLRVCPTCAQELAEIQSLKSMLTKMSVPEPSADFTARLRLSVTEKQSQRPLVWRGVFAAGLGAAAALTVWMITQRSNPSATVTDRGMPSEIARDQAFVAGGDPLTGHYPVMPASHDLR